MKNNILLSVILAAFFMNGAIAQSMNSPEDEAALTQLRAFAKKQGLTMSPEQEQSFLQQQRAMQARIKAGALGLMGASGLQRGAQIQTAQPSGSSAAAVAVQTEEKLAEKLASLPNRPTPFVLEDRKDGFIVNGQGFVDPEGPIRNYAINPVSGMMSYLAETEKDAFIVKVGRAGTNTDSITVASAIRTGSGWQVQTVTGKKITGNSLTMLVGGGFLLTRETAAFIYTPGKGLRSIAVPNGYVAAGFQRGDVLGTEYLLLERDVADAGQGAQLFNSLKSIGSILGMNTKEDYALFNLITSEVVPIDISEGGKKVSDYSNCKRKNSFVNTCANVDFRESLYNSTGRNPFHYFWRINWFNSKTGPVLIALENSVKNITIKDLKTKKKVIAFNRTLGISGFDTTQDSDGNIHIGANMGLSREKIDDAVAFLASNPDASQSGNPEIASTAKDGIDSK